MRKAIARIWSILLVCAMLLAAFPAAVFAEPEGEPLPGDTKVIYVSQEGTDSNDGLTPETPTSLTHATELANQAGKTTEIVVIGQVTIDTWTSPAVATTLRGQDESSELLFAYCPASNYRYNISMSGALIIDKIRLNCDYSEYKFSTYYGTYTIVANGYPLTIASGAKAAYYMSDTTIDGKRFSTSACTVIGGGLDTDVTQGTHVEIYTSLPLTTVIGGGYDGNVSGDVFLLAQNCGKVQQILGGGYSNDKAVKVTGDIYFDFFDSVTDNAIYGGGFVKWAEASVVEGNITLNLRGMSYGYGKPVYGGCSGKNSSVTGNIVINASNIDMRNNNAGIYGGGYQAVVNGNVEINIDKSVLCKNIFGGGNDAAVDGNVKINISNCSSVETYIYGGGESDRNKSGDVTGNIDIVLSGGTTDFCPKIYATGKGSNKLVALVGGDARISLIGSRAEVYTLGQYGSMAEGKSVTVTLDDMEGLNGAVRGDADKKQYLYNYDPNDKTKHVANTKVVVTGDYATTGIYYFGDIEIKDGGVLREHLSDSTAKLFNETENLVIESGGALDLLQSNEITGTAQVSGRLVMPKAAELTADGAVSVFDGAVYEPTDGYERYDIFLQTKTEYTQQDKTAFDVTEAGKAEFYYTADRAGTAQDMVHEWYVNQLPKVSVTPADITVYTGGDGYDGVVDDDGKLVTDQDNGLPEAGFYIELPQELDEQLKQELNVDKDTTLDLSKYLYFTNGSKTWTLELYDGEQTSIVNGKYIYRLVAALGQDPVRMQFIDDQKNVEISDQFDLSKTLYSKYDMEIYPGAVEKGTVQAVIRVNGKEVKYPIEANTGKLTIRGVTQKGETTKVVSTVGQAVSNITAVLPADTVYTINDSDVQVVSGTPALLVDEIVSPDNTQNGKDFRTLLTNKAVETAAQDFKNVASQARYLDLVDAANGNTWIKADKPVTIYWPYPAGTNADTQFRLVHFVGMNREMTADEAASGIETATVETIPVKTDAYGISFTTDSFSPFVLMWDNTQTTTVTEQKPDEHPDIAEAKENGTWGQPTPTPAPAAASVIPQTSDDMPLGLLIGLAVVAVVAIVVLIVLRQRRKR